MISKELMSEVLGHEVEEVKSNNSETLYFNNVEHGDFINLHHLAHKCKEWVFKQGYYLDSGKEHNNWRCFISTKEYGSMMKADTEPEAIFKACEWILNNQDN